ncbi:uroporphyrinogen decarboxylase family protein [Carboxylicivirga caseinilyticus]|uniref:uroporphyrinogen decarboxylase family protein n=1 Tax=Carboxylicivirga caseinilyticus TaxID=3417572 RepID=UPI003D345FFC|nr:uroporphyrinogen-III decarboxylase [Marinilabiliaceae bacterium A049]
MIHKERVLKALNNEQPDRVPFFYWDVPEFGVKLMKHLGLENRDQLLEYLDVDFRWVEPDYVGEKLIKEEGKKKVDIWGVGYSKVKNGDFEYWEATKFPLEGITDPAFLDDYNWPTTSLFDFTTLSSKIEKYKDYAIMTAPGYSSPGLFRIIQRLLGREAFLDVIMYHPKFFEKLSQKIVGFYTDFIAEFFDNGGDKIDFIRIADDFGTQSGLAISNDIWEQYCKPAIEAFTEIPKQHGVRFYMHSCGGVRKLLPEFISLGASILDPIQTRAFGMEPLGLKEDFGNYITFCGALDEELLLRKGTPREVKDGVKHLLDMMAPKGGFVLGPSHKLKVETPVENVVAMYEAAKEWTY